MSAAEIRLWTNILKITHIRINIPWTKRYVFCPYAFAVIAGPWRRKHAHALQSFKNKVEKRTNRVLSISETHGNDKMFRFVFLFFIIFVSLLVNAHCNQSSMRARCLFLFRRMNQCNWWYGISDSVNVCSICTRWKTRRNAKHKTFITQSLRNVMFFSPSFTLSSLHFHLFLFLFLLRFVYFRVMRTYVLSWSLV